MNLWLIPVGIYVGVTLILLGALMFDEMTFRNPEYGIAAAVAIGWPFLVGFAALKWWINYRRSQ